MDQQELIRGSIAAIVYQNHENGYAVTRLTAESGETITVVGVIPMPTVGERLVVTGKWSHHASYGRQFEAELVERLMPEAPSEIMEYLSSGIIKGIGRKTAARIVDLFGMAALDIIEQEPEKLVGIPGISLKKAKEISESFSRQVGVRRLIEFLALHRLPVEMALQLFRIFGDLAVDALRDDPYILADAYFKGDFAQVDAFAVELGVEGDDERRVEAGLLFELRHNLQNGHTFLPKSKLASATCNLLSLDQQTIEAAMVRLDEEERLVLTTIRDLDVCYLPEFYEAELYVSKRILTMTNERAFVPSNLDKLVAQVEGAKQLSYGQEQLDAMKNAAIHQILIVTGGPGTGKTTTLDGILDLFDVMGLNSQLAAPTGRAAKRLSQLTGREAATIHRMLEAQYSAEAGQMVFCKNEDELLNIDALILDEMSMVDLQLMQSVLRALKPTCRLILVGDPDQLPSVGPGNLFSDIIRSNLVPMVRLTEIYRQAQESMIVMSAHAINQGEVPNLGYKDRDFFFMRRKDPQALVQTVCDLCSHRLPKNMGIDPKDIQILSPTRKNETGTGNLNIRLQAVLNPPSPEKKEKQYGDTLFRQGDRVMQIRNNYDIIWKSTDGRVAGAGIFNGDIGIIDRIDFEREELTIIFDDDKQAQYGFDMLSELEMAYAMTVHKSQGSEYPVVILIVHQGSPYLLNRSILYTAVTRARDMLILIGDESVVESMVANNHQQRRYSGLKLQLQKDGMACGK